MRQPSAVRTWSQVVELRQYTLHPGGRETLIALFDSTFVEPQEAAGMTVIGQFRDLDDADKFVWLRGFSDMERRAASLAEFYDGPVWREHRDAANATMVDSDDVLLLRPARAGSAFRPSDRLPANGGARDVVAATIVDLDGPEQEQEALSFFEQAIAPAVRASGGAVLASFVTEPSENTFPRLPVREGEHVAVLFASFPGAVALDQALSGLAGTPVRVLRLAPTARSRLPDDTTREERR
jgi:hypothetical protein